jgi:hypothetical protein
MRVRQQYLTTNRLSELSTSRLTSMNGGKKLQSIEGGERG